MSNKTNKNNKKNSVVITWPTSHFTIEDVWNQIGGEKEMPNITLRFRVKKAVENKEIVAIGKIKPAIGRPKLVFAKANPSKELIEAAKAAGVVPIEETKSSITVAEVKTEKKVKAVVPVVNTKESTTNTTSVTNAN